MTVTAMRAALEKKYKPGFTKKMSDLQVIAIYNRLKGTNQI